jgi:hypothetical protein
MAKRKITDMDKEGMKRGSMMRTRKAMAIANVSVHCSASSRPSSDLNHATISSTMPSGFSSSGFFGEGAFLGLSTDASFSRADSWTMFFGSRRAKHRHTITGTSRRSHAEVRVGGCGQHGMSRAARRVGGGRREGEKE